MASLLHLTKGFLEYEHLVNNKSVSQIARENNVTVSGLHRRFNALKIPVRRFSKTLIHIICEWCQKSFQRDLIKVKYNKHNNKKNYCSLSCMAQHRNEGRKGKPFVAYKYDNLSHFRHQYTSISNRKRECYLKLEDLKSIWDSQRGICPYTGWNLALDENTNRRAKKSPRLGSLDRIDSFKNYYKENVEYICLMSQYGKNIFTKEDLIFFCKSTALRHYIFIFLYVVWYNFAEKKIYFS